MIAIDHDIRNTAELSQEDRRVMCAQVRCHLDTAILLQPYARLSKVAVAIALVWQQISRLERTLAKSCCKPCGNVGGREYSSTGRDRQRE